MTEALGHSSAAFPPPPAAPALIGGVMQGFPPPPEQRATLENWDRPPFNRWSFQNMRRIFPTAAVSRGDGPVHRFARDEGDLGAVGFDAMDGRRITVDQLLAETWTDGFIVLHDGRIVAERTFGRMTESSAHLSQSVSKSIVGTLAGILIHQGALDPEAPVAHYVPELERSGYRGARVRHLLDMTSGVRFSEDYGDPDADITRLEAAAGWRASHDPSLPACVYDFIATLVQEREHGLIFRYRSVETDTLGWVMERAAGIGLAELLGREIWSKLGAEHDAFYTLDRAGAALADGGFNATLRDYARFAQMHLDGGVFNGRRIVPEAWVRASRTGDPAIFGEPYASQALKGAYAKQWWIWDLDRGITTALGVFGQMIYLNPEARVAAVKLSSWPDFLNLGYKLNTLRAMDAISAALAG